MSYVAKTALAAAITLSWTSFAQAVTLNLRPVSPRLEASSAVIDYLEFAGDGDLSTFGAEIDFADGVSPTGFTELSFGFGFPLADPTVGATGGFDVFDDDGLFLGGDLFAVGFTDSVIELQFNNLGGAAAVAFDSSALAQISFFNALGPNPFNSLVDGEFYEASISLSSVGAIPLPAGLPLLVTGLGGVFLLRQKRRQS